MTERAIKKVYKKLNIYDQKSDFEFWQSQSYSARLAALEEIRQEYHTWREMLNKDFKEFIELLNNNHVRYLIGGGYAEAFHGYPRYTKDMDVWIDASLKNAERIIVSLEQFGFGSLGLLVEDFLEPDKIIQLGNPPLRIDLMTSVPGVEFESCYNSRIVLDLEGVIVNFIDLENLKKNKKASGRFQDLTDIENLDG